MCPDRSLSHKRLPVTGTLFSNLAGGRRDAEGAREDGEMLKATRPPPPRKQRAQWPSTSAPHQSHGGMEDKGPSPLWSYVWSGPVQSLSIRRYL